MENYTSKVMVLDSTDLKFKVDQDDLDHLDFKLDHKLYLEADLVLYKRDNGQLECLKSRYFSLTPEVVVNPGYHTIDIPKGELGEFSKIKEECLELEDALNQGSEVMALVELSDLYGAIESYLEKHHKLTVGDLKKFSDITKRAFKNGRRS
jgi:hypothetical protein